jgi:hypothetical protein
MLESRLKSFSAVYQCIFRYVFFFFFWITPKIVKMEFNKTPPLSFTSCTDECDLYSFIYLIYMGYLRTTGAISIGGIIIITLFSKLCIIIDIIL